ncbi:MAG: hypothetical protein JSV09_00280 [Thermoplasmata archaeon]|nr:MAG: hypothetical protein JSV09_00280 [Thermoplasmata archaeon]
MPGWITYMEVSMYSEGATPWELTNKLKEHGWKPVYGRYDYAYKWDQNWGNKDHNIQEFLEFINTWHEIMKGYNVHYSLRTYEEGKEDFWVKWSE